MFNQLNYLYTYKGLYRNLVGPGPNVVLSTVQTKFCPCVLFLSLPDVKGVTAIHLSRPQYQPQRVKSTNPQNYVTKYVVFFPLHRLRQKRPPPSLILSHAIFLPSSPYLVIFLSLPIMSVLSPMERQRKREGQRRGRKVCFSGEDNIPRLVPFLFLLIECTHAHTQTHTKAKHKLFDHCSYCGN